MSETSTGPLPTGAPHPLTRLAVGLAAAAAVTWLVLAAVDHDGGLWLFMAAFALGAAVVGYRAGGTSPKNLPAFVAFVIGLLGVLSFLTFVISDL